MKRKNEKISSSNHYYWCKNVFSRISLIIIQFLDLDLYWLEVFGTLPPNIYCWRIVRLYCLRKKITRGPNKTAEKLSRSHHR